ncbi:MAG TPA: SCP2 sterol-binding domain-containing protein, partial [Anaerolineae bacterium]|nr:SCP2 sterol-binding domain-containing protein [Anaerolineae bacterium]
NHLPRLITDPAGLEEYELTLTPSQLRALVEVISNAGWHHRPLRHTDGEAIILWNNESADMRYKLTALDGSRPHVQKGPLPRFACLTLTNDALTVHVGAQLAQGQITLDNWLASLPDRVNLAQVGAVNAVVQFQVTGEHGRSAKLMLENGRVTLNPAPDQPPDAAIATAETDWLALINGRETPENLFVQGKLHLSGDMALILKLADAFTITPPGQFRPDKWRLTLHYRDILYKCLPDE